MAKKASTYLTGGAGFNFEDAIAAYHLVSMLCGRCPLGDEFGTLSRIVWQGTDVHWLLDDLVLFGEDGTARGEAGMSIKSNAHLTGSGFARDFVDRCWRQFRGETGRPFNVDADLLCLGVGTLSEDAKKAWQLLHRQARKTEPARMVDRLKAPGTDEGSQASATQRAILQSLVDNAPGNDTPTQVEAIKLLRCIRVLHFDFLAEPSEMEDKAISDCQRLLESGKREEAQRLWQALILIARDYRATGGDVRREDLLGRLSNDFSLRPAPKLAPHIERWQDISAERLSLAPWGVPDAPPLPRTSLLEALANCIAEGRPAIVVGETGTGKTSLVRRFCETVEATPLLLDSHLISPGGELEGFRLRDCPYDLDELLQGTPGRSGLIIDAAERLEGDELHRACWLIASAADLAAEGHTMVLVTCQPDGVERMLLEFHRRDIPRPMLCHVIRPDEGEIRELLAHSRSLQHAAIDDPLIRVLTNLKVLELASRAAHAGAVLSRATESLPTRLIDFLWRQWIEGRGGQVVRGAMLQRLAIAEDESLVAGAPIHQLNPTELERVPELIADGLVTRFDERLRFNHELIGDWSRLRVLIADGARGISDRSQHYLWRRAVRLYAQRLAESDPSGGQWLRAFGGLPSTERTGRDSPARTLFVEGLLLACAALPQLAENVWPNLRTIGGDAICLLLLRLRNIATRLDTSWPNPLSPSANHRFGPWQIPESAIWTPVLHAVDREGDWPPEMFDILAENCAMLLRRQFIVRSLPIDLVRLAARVSLRLGRIVIVEDRYDRLDLRSLRQGNYETLLLAAIELPAEVAELALIAARRRRAGDSESAANSPESAEEYESQAGPDSFPHLNLDLADILGTRNETSEPWPDGPAEEVDEAFRDVCLDTDALVPLINVAPAVAVEVLLACSIEEPPSRIQDVGWNDDHIGLFWRISRPPPFYNRGPFLSLFDASPDHGVDLLLRLINFATDRWFESPSRARLEEIESDRMFNRLGPAQVGVPLAQGAATWFGSANMYCWSLGGLPSNVILTSTLMAFEYWLYREIANDGDVTLQLERVMSEGHSVGFAGMLIDVGKRHPHLFRGPLRPLLGCWTFLAWDRFIRIQRVGGSAGLLAWAFHANYQERQEAEHWHNAPHRSKDLVEIAREFFIRDPEFRAYMEDCRRSWKDHFDGAGRPHDLRHLAANFDWSNYQLSETAAGESQLVFTLPAQLTEGSMRMWKQADDQQHALTFPRRCRQILGETGAVSDETIEAVWRGLQRTENLAADVFPIHAPSRREDGLAAGSAVLLRAGDDRLTNEQQQQCRHIFERLLRSPPRRGPIDFSESPGNRSWDHFFADMALDYLCRNNDDRLARRALAHTITAFHYSALEHAMELACARRAQLGELFPSLTNMVFHWAVRREQLRRVGQSIAQREEWLNRVHDANASDSSDTAEMAHTRERITQELSALRAEDQLALRRLEELCRQFCEANVPAIDARRLLRDAIEDLETIALNTGVRMLYPARQRGNDRIEHEDLGLDLDVLRHGLNWLQIRHSDEPAERAVWVGWLHNLVMIHDELVPEMAGRQRFASHGYGAKFDSFMDMLLARNIMNLESGEQDTRLFRHVLDRVDVAPQQVEWFLRVWFAVASDDRPQPDRFVDRWMDIVAYALQAPGWAADGRGSTPSRLWSALLGGDLNGSDEVWIRRLGLSLQRHEGLILQAIDGAFRNRDTMGLLAMNFQQPAWRYLRPALLIQFANFMRVGELPLDGFPGDSIASFLSCCWEEHKQELITQSDLAGAFQFLLSQSNAVGSPVAEQLSEMVAQWLGEKK